MSSDKAGPLVEAEVLGAEIAAPSDVSKVGGGEGEGEGEREGERPPAARGEEADPSKGVVADLAKAESATPGASPPQENYMQKIALEQHLRSKARAGKRASPSPMGAARKLQNTSAGVVAQNIRGSIRAGGPADVPLNGLR